MVFRRGRPPLTAFRGTLGRRSWSRALVCHSLTWSFASFQKRVKRRDGRAAAHLAAGFECLHPLLRERIHEPVASSGGDVAVENGMAAALSCTAVITVDADIRNVLAKVTSVAHLMAR